MTEKEILEHNKNVFDAIKYNNDDIEKLKIMNDTLKNNIIAPCEYCPLGGFFRCEACEKRDYAGFKIDIFENWE